MSQDPNLHVIQHALIEDRLGRMRRKDTPPQEFRQCMREIADILAIEASRNLPVMEKEIETPITTTTIKTLDKQRLPLIVPILRAGLGLSQGMQDALPEADTGHIGVYRDEETHRPVEYLVKLPKHLDRPVFVCDPMLATGHSMEKTLDVLIERGAKESSIVIVTLLCAPEGIEVIRNRFKNIPIYTAALDSHLNENAYIVPGLGDAGDRIFGTV